MGAGTTKHFGFSDAPDAAAPGTHASILFRNTTPPTGMQRNQQTPYTCFQQSQNDATNHRHEAIPQNTTCETDSHSSTSESENNG